jgi:hypothetical protein
MLKAALALLLVAAAHATVTTPAHVKNLVSDDDHIIRCPARMPQSDCQANFPSVSASDHNGYGQGVTERVSKMIENKATGEWSNTLIAKDSIDYNHPGTYLLTYTADDAAGNTAEQKVFALIIDDRSRPVITVCTSMLRTTPVETGADWNMCQSTCADDVDGVCTVDVRYKLTNTADGYTASGLTVSQASAKLNRWSLGTWTVEMSYTDSSGNTGKQTKQIVVEDNSSPSITVNGRSPVNDLECKATYTDGTATASDTYDDHKNFPIAVSHNITGTVDSAAEGHYVTRANITFDNLADAVGSYRIEYSASDSEGNPAPKPVRPVTVVDTTKPTLDLNGFSLTQQHYAGEQFTSPSAVTCDDTCDSSPTITEEWIKGGGIPSTYDPSMPAYAARLDPATGCALSCSGATPTPCGATCISEATTCTAAADAAWSACSEEVFNKIMVQPGERKANPPTYFSLNLAEMLKKGDNKHGLTYTKKFTCIDYNGLKDSAQVVYSLVDRNKPIIKLNGDAATEEIEASLLSEDAWTDAGATCSDWTQGVINSQITVAYGATGKPNVAKPGVYTVTYSCKDTTANQNAADDVTRTVKVTDDVCPELELKGNAIQVVEAGFPWVDPGWTLSDNITPEGDMTVVRTGCTVDTAQAFRQFRSCAEIKHADKDAPSGPYSITVKLPGDTLHAREVVCDMTGDTVTYFKVTNDPIRAYLYQQDGTVSEDNQGKCPENGFRMAVAAELTQWAKDEFGDDFTTIAADTNEYLCTLDPAVVLNHDVQHISMETIKYATKGVYTCKYRTEDGEGVANCGGERVRTVVVRDSMAPVIVVTRGNKYATSAMGSAQKAKLATLPTGEAHRDGIPNKLEVHRAFLRGALKKLACVDKHNRAPCDTVNNVCTSQLDLTPLAYNPINKKCQKCGFLDQYPCANNRCEEKDGETTLVYNENGNKKCSPCGKTGQLPCASNQCESGCINANNGKCKVCPVA